MTPQQIAEKIREELIAGHWPATYTPDAELLERVVTKLDLTAAPPKVEGSAGARRIADERQRQVSVEGWTSHHDDEHSLGEMALAAALYATPILLKSKEEYANCESYSDPWPWDDRYDKRPTVDNGNVIAPNETLPISDRVRQLEKAGALIAAEIDRLLRISVAPVPVVEGTVTR